MTEQQANKTPNDLSHENVGELVDLLPTTAQESDIKGGPEYSAIAFVGGWGSSMYQYAYNDPNVRPPAAGSLVKP